VVARNANEAMVGSGGACFWPESDVWRSVLCWWVWQEHDFRSSKDIFTFHLLYKDLFIYFLLSVRFAKIIRK
jgi:hypothetical protein